MKQFSLHRKKNTVLVVQNLLAACFLVSLFLVKISVPKLNSKNKGQFSKAVVVSLKSAETCDKHDNNDLKLILTHPFFSIPESITFTCLGIHLNKKSNNNRKRLKYYTLYCCLKIVC